MQRGINYEAASEKIAELTSIKDSMNSTLTDGLNNVNSKIRETYVANASDAFQTSLEASRKAIIDALEEAIKTMNEAIHVKSEDYAAWDSKQASSIE